MNFSFSAPVKRFVDPTNSGKPSLKATPTQNKFQLNASAMNLMGASKGSRVNILHNAMAENINEAFALVIVGEESPGAVIGIPKNSSRGEFSFSGKYGMMIAMDTQIDFSPEELVEKGIMEKRTYVSESTGEEVTKYGALQSVSAEIQEGVEMEIEGEVYVIYPLTEFKATPKKSGASDDDDDDDAIVDEFGDVN